MMVFSVLICSFVPVVSAQTIMRDRWMNIGHEGDDLIPYIEPSRMLDERRIGNCVYTGIYSLEKYTFCIL